MRRSALAVASFASIAALAFSSTAPLRAQDRRPPDVPKWGRFEAVFTSAAVPANPLLDVDLKVAFTAPSGKRYRVDAFWDGDAVWRVRFSPDETGTWRYTTTARPSTDTGLHGRSGSFRVSAPSGSSRFDRHGPVRVSATRTFLEHADGTPFFWMADTGWNAALLSTPDEWQTYVRERARQRFTAVQWVATQWRAAPHGDLQKMPAYSGTERIAINVPFFQRLDEKVVALNQAGLLNVPVLLWAIASGSNPAVNPGVSLPEDQAIALVRYMVARWQGDDVIWILGGDGDYRGDRAEKWRRIGRAAFGDGAHAPVLMHPGGMHWILSEFQKEPWIGIHGYQSGHGDDDKTLRWITEGPPARDWSREPIRPFINLEPPYEYHVAYQSRMPIAPEAVRRAVYWSLLNAPTAGVSYGGHGIWGWDDGTAEPTDHPGTGKPLPWRKALAMPAAGQMTHVSSLFQSIDFSKLTPAPDILAEQPGREAGRRFIAAAASPSRDLVVIYTPEAAGIAIRAAAIKTRRARWHDPRTGARTTAQATTSGATMVYRTPGEGDWVLLLTR